MKDLVEVIAKALVDKPDEVVVTEIEGQQASVVELKVAKDDIGEIIGKQGRTAAAIRTILNAASAKLDKRSVLQILEGFRLEALLSPLIYAGLGRWNDTCFGQTARPGFGDT